MRARSPICPWSSETVREFTADLQFVAEHYAPEWKREWGYKDTFAFHQELRSICALHETHVKDAGEWANGTDVSAVYICAVCLPFPFKTSIGLDQHSFQDIARLPDIDLVSLGEIVRQTQSLLQLLVLLGKKKRR